MTLCHIPGGIEPSASPMGALHISQGHGICCLRRRIAWMGHVLWLDDKRIPNKTLEWKPMGMRIRGRPRKRLIANIEVYMQITGIKSWRKQCKERAKWTRINEKAKFHRVL